MPKRTSGETRWQCRDCPEQQTAAAAAGRQLTRTRHGLRKPHTKQRKHQQWARPAERQDHVISATHRFACRCYAISAAYCLDALVMRMERQQPPTARALSASSQLMVVMMHVALRTCWTYQGSCRQVRHGFGDSCAGVQKRTNTHPRCARTPRVRHAMAAAAQLQPAQEHCCCLRRRNLALPTRRVRARSIVGASSGCASACGPYAPQT